MASQYDDQNLDREQNITPWLVFSVLGMLVLAGLLLASAYRGDEEVRGRLSPTEQTVPGEAVISNRDDSAARVVPGETNQGSTPNRVDAGR
jgi:hypothetical protein